MPSKLDFMPDRVSIEKAENGFIVEVSGREKGKDKNEMGSFKNLRYAYDSIDEVNAGLKLAFSSMKDLKKSDDPLPEEVVKAMGNLRSKKK